MPGQPAARRRLSHFAYRSRVHRLNGGSPDCAFAVKAPRILIVDDDASQRSLLDSFLKSQGFQTVPVDSGERALEVLRTQPISMMISDVRMPGLSGLETLQRGRLQDKGLA